LEPGKAGAKENNEHSPAQRLKKSIGVAAAASVSLALAA
jgi:hypothetical protein